MDNQVHTNDILISLANLSNDEVFTPPKVVKQMLDMLPEELWSDPTLKWLDPCCKSGVFLREITKRLYGGLASVIKNNDERREHIFNHMVYGLALSDLTALMTRRTLYGNKNAQSPTLSMAKTMRQSDGNIYYNKEQEAHKYAFINQLPKELQTMKFDVIIGNPPYQIDNAKEGTERANASPLYHKFVEQAIKMEPKYVSFIIPARWYTGGMGLKDFRQKMLTDKRLKELHDFLYASECFDDVDIRGGVCYFLWAKDYHGDCTVYNHSGGNINSTMTRPLLEENSQAFVRFNEAIAILKQIQAKAEPSFSPIVSIVNAFGLLTDFRDCKSEPFANSIKLYYYDKRPSTGYINKEQILNNPDWVDKWKVYISEAYDTASSSRNGEGSIRPFIGETNTACTGTYLVIGPFNSEAEAKSCQSFMQSTLFYFLVCLLKNTQHATAKVYQLVPLLPFTHIYTDAELYQRYNLSPSQIAYIEGLVRPMEAK